MWIEEQRKRRLLPAYVLCQILARLISLIFVALSSPLSRLLSLTLFHFRVFSCALLTHIIRHASILLCTSFFLFLFPRSPFTRLLFLFLFSRIRRLQPSALDRDFRWSSLVVLIFLAVLKPFPLCRYHCGCLCGTFPGS